MPFTYKCKNTLDPFIYYYGFEYPKSENLTKEEIRHYNYDDNNMDSIPFQMNSDKLVEYRRHFRTADIQQQMKDQETIEAYEVSSRNEEHINNMLRNDGDMQARKDFAYWAFTPSMKEGLDTIKYNGLDKNGNPYIKQFYGRYYSLGNPNYGTDETVLDLHPDLKLNGNPIPFLNYDVDYSKFSNMLTDPNITEDIKNSTYELVFEPEKQYSLLFGIDVLEPDNIDNCFRAYCKRIDNEFYSDELNGKDENYEFFYNQVINGKIEGIEYRMDRDGREYIKFNKSNILGPKLCYQAGNRPSFWNSKNIRLRVYNGDTEVPCNEVDDLISFYQYYNTIAEDYNAMEEANEIEYEQPVLTNPYINDEIAEIENEYQVTGDIDLYNKKRKKAYQNIVQGLVAKGDYAYSASSNLYNDNPTLIDIDDPDKKSNMWQLVNNAINENRCYIRGGYEMNLDGTWTNGMYLTIAPKEGEKGALHSSVKDLNYYDVKFDSNSNEIGFTVFIRDLQNEKSTSNSNFNPELLTQSQLEIINKYGSTYRTLEGDKITTLVDPNGNQSYRFEYLDATYNNDSPIMLNDEDLKRTIYFDKCNRLLRESLIAPYITANNEFTNSQEYYNKVAQQSALISQMYNNKADLCYADGTPIIKNEKGDAVSFAEIIGNKDYIQNLSEFIVNDDDNFHISIADGVEDKVNEATLNMFLDYVDMYNRLIAPAAFYHNIGKIQNK